MEAEKKEKEKEYTCREERLRKGGNKKKILKDIQQNFTN